MLRKLLIAAVVAAMASIGLAPFPSASAAPTFADAEDATVHPGVMTFTDGAQCTANFVFHDSTDIYIGQAAHCSGLGAATDTNGCDAGTLPVGTAVEVTGASRPGTLAYSSWVTMQAVGETDPSACAYNDFALIRLHPDDHDLVNPSVPAFGGPVALGTTTGFGEQVYTYGNSSLRFGVTQLSPKTGVSLGQSGGGWTHTVYTVTPGIPGDSGSGVMDSQGRAIGTLSTVALAPLTGSNGVSDLANELAYANRHGQMAVQLATGTETFLGEAGMLDGLLGG